MLPRQTRNQRMDDMNTTPLQPLLSRPALLRGMAVISGSLLIWLAARIEAPFWPVPMTMQTLAVLALAAVLGRRLGVAAVALYLVEGALGLPVFAGSPERGIGLAYMAGPTGGYLAGFLLAAAVVGHLAGSARGPLRLFAVMLAGTALIYLPGVLWLSAFTGPKAAVMAGLVPFLPGDILKAAVAALAVTGLRSMPRRAR